MTILLDRMEIYSREILVRYKPLLINFETGLLAPPKTGRDSKSCVLEKDGLPAKLVASITARAKTGIGDFLRFVPHTVSPNSCA